MLRKNGTVAEWMLWQRLKNKQWGDSGGIHIGYYIADFCSPRKKLVIELDGGVHDDEGARYTIKNGKKPSKRWVSKYYVSETKNGKRYRKCRK